MTELEQNRERRKKDRSKEFEEMEYDVDDLKNICINKHGIQGYEDCYNQNY